MGPLEINPAVPNDGVKRLQVLLVLDRLLVGRPPVVFLPVLDPLGHAVDDKLAVSVQVQLFNIQALTIGGD